jgi:hypothetical protein
MICPCCGQNVDDRLFVDGICVQCVEDLAQYNDDADFRCSDFEDVLADESETDPPA